MMKRIRPQLYSTVVDQNGRHLTVVGHSYDTVICTDENGGYLQIPLSSFTIEPQDEAQQVIDEYMNRKAGLQPSARR